MIRFLPRFFGTLALMAAASSVFSQTNLFTNIEAVEYDPGSGRFFVSNNSSIVQKLPDGSYSLFGSAEASHGMEVMDGVLFVIKGTQVRGYHLETAAQVMTLAVPGAQFLNGMASDPATNRLWVTDFQGKRIYEINVADLDSPTVQTVVANTVSTPNGIVYDEANNRLLFANWGSGAAIKAVNLEDYSVSTVHSTGMGNIDGIVLDNSGRVCISTWQPQRITRYSENFSQTETILSSGLGNPADICYAHGVDTLAIPNSSTSQVIFLGFSSTSVEESALNIEGISLYPNPAADMVRLTLEARESGRIRVELLDTSGRLAVIMADESVPAGRVILPYAVASLAKGHYFVKVDFGGEIKTLPLHIH
jgi:DNA-binding beta-propeller fold protein YncE